MCCSVLTSSFVGRGRGCCLLFHIAPRIKLQALCMQSSSLPLSHNSLPPSACVHACVHACVRGKGQRTALSVSPQALTTFDFENSLTSLELGEWLRLAGQRTTGFHLVLPSTGITSTCGQARHGIFKIWGLKIKLGVFIVPQQAPCWLSFHGVYCYCEGKLDGRFLYSLKQYDSIIFTNFKVIWKKLHP